MKNFSKTPEDREDRHRLSASFKVGAIAFAFLVIGYQAALLIHSASLARAAAIREKPDTVFVVDGRLAARLLGAESGSADEPIKYDSDFLRDNESDAGTYENVTVYRTAEHDQMVDKMIESAGMKRIESFPFDPNKVSINDLQRLGFSEKQARAIIAYREAGGHFRRPADFAKSYVVADSVFKRLEPSIRIPRLDINSADSAAFETLPGIGPYYAALMVEYREKLGGYSYPEQLMDLRNFTQDKFDGLSDLITVGPSTPYGLWELSEEELEKHPYIGSYGAHGIVIYRENNAREALTVEGLAAAGVLRAGDAERLGRCRIAAP